MGQQLKSQPEEEIPSCTLFWGYPFYSLDRKGKRNVYLKSLVPTLAQIQMLRDLYVSTALSVQSKCELAATGKYHLVFMNTAVKDSKQRKTNGSPSGESIS